MVYVNTLTSLCDAGKGKQPARSFNHKWLEKFEWLRYEKAANGDEVAWCEVCRKADTSSLYGTGIKCKANEVPKFHRSSWLKHGLSSSHLKCVQESLGNAEEDISRYANVRLWHLNLTVNREN
jgi:hypothetical protein